MAYNDINELESPLATATIYGLIGGMLAIITAFIPGGMLIGWFSILIFPALAIKRHRDKDLDGYISYGRGVSTGTITTVIISLIAIAAFATVGGANLDGLAKVISPLIYAIFFLIFFVPGFVFSLIAASSMKKEREEEIEIKIE